MTINLILLVALLLGGIAAVMLPRILSAIIAFAVTSVVLTIVMFRLNAPLAAVFELSISAGLIPVIFVTTITLTRRLTNAEFQQRTKIHLGRFWFLPVLLAVLAFVLAKMTIPADFNAVPPAPDTNPADLLWNVRRLDLIGQIVLLLTGALGVAALFKEAKK